MHCVTCYMSNKKKTDKLLKEKKKIKIKCNTSCQVPDVKTLKLTCAELVFKGRCEIDFLFFKRENHVSDRIWPNAQFFWTHSFSFCTLTRFLDGCKQPHGRIILAATPNPIIPPATRRPWRGCTTALVRESARSRGPTDLYTTPLN